MQFLVDKFKFRFATQGFKADKYSPFNSYIDDIQNKRSRLFPDRRRIPGRKMKYIIACVYLVHFYAVMTIFQTKQLYKRKAEQQVVTQRKIAPFFQALNDQQYTTVKHRWDLLTKEVLGQNFVKQRFFHNNKISWVPTLKDYNPHSRSGMERYHGSVLQYSANRYINGFQIQNI